MKKLNRGQIEKKWQEKWKEEKLYKPDIDKAKNSFYNLWMFPYPSAEGLHAGHAFSSTASDIYGRFKRMGGRSVFQPIGYDSFGIHTENFALKIKEHPQEMLKRTTSNYERQLRSLGHGYDWSRTVTTSDPDYYQWTQWLFVKMFKAGLAYRQKASVNWCPSCKTVLADEQVITDACERCNTKVEIKDLEQWFFRITNYADRLLENLGKIDWPERIKAAQTNWIGKSNGAVVSFPLKGSKLSVSSFTTRPDTLYGATFFVLAPEHPMVTKLTTSKYQESIQKYVKKASNKTKEERIARGKVKKGVFTGGYVVNPATKEDIPVYVADYVLMEYGTGAVMGVPAHDARDWQFAKNEDLPIREVVSGGNVKKEAYKGDGKLVNSGDWDKLSVPEKMSSIVDDLEKKGWGEKSTTYHLRDWLISRQRYWGPPIPVIHCEKCASQKKSYFTSNKNVLEKDQSDWDHFGWYPADEKALPVKLPHYEDYRPKGAGRGPLADHPDFFGTKCPGCGGDAKRETDVSDTFLDSSWYFLRYPSVDAVTSKKLPFDPERTKDWLPVDLYFGGAEHSVLHLMYARFVTQVLFDLKKISFDEPFPHFFAHGLLIKDGAKMSKSRGNVVNPDDYIKKYGADTLRLYLMFMGPVDQNPDFKDTGIEGMVRFINRIWDLFNTYSDVFLEKESDSREVLSKMHKTIKKVTEDVNGFRYNTAISALMEFTSLLREKAKKGKKKKGQIRCAEWDEALETLALLLAPFAPHLAEEVWVFVLKKDFSVHTQVWPKFKEELVKEKKTVIVVQVNGKLRGQVLINSNQAGDKAKIEKIAKEDERVFHWLEKKQVKKTIFVPGRIINFVTD